MSEDEDVRFAFQLPHRLREDAKRSTDRGELSERCRDLFRRIAYGEGATKGNDEIDRLKAELRDVRDRIDDLRRERRKIDAEIETQESRANRLEERISNLEERADTFETAVETLERMLLDGARIFPERVDDELNAETVIRELKERNPDVPEYAFEVAGHHEPIDWREVDQ